MSSPSTIQQWITDISGSIDAYDKTEILQWYELSKDKSKNPGQFIDLNEYSKTYFSSINESLLNGGFDDDEVKNILTKLKTFYKNLDDVSQRDELVLFDLMIETFKLTKGISKGIFAPKIDFKASFPKFEAHFNKNKLELLKLSDFFKSTGNYNPVDFICRFRQIITKDVIEKLDKALEIENRGDSTNATFSYQSELEFCYIDIIIKMIITTYKDDTMRSIVAKTIEDWLNAYPFRLMNSKGLYTPDNFFISFNNYVGLLVGDDKKRIDYYFAFFNKLKLTRSPVQANIETHIDFLDKYDSSAKYEQNGIDTLSESIRSIHFREDFDYLNSINIKGINLNRKFWTILDKYVAGKNLNLGKYISLVSTAKGLDEFYNTITSDLDIGNNDFLMKMKEQMDRYNKICEAPNTDFDPPIDNNGSGAHLEQQKAEEDSLKNGKLAFDADLVFIDDSEHKSLAKKGIHFLDRKIRLEKADGNFYHYQKSEKTNIFKNPKNKSDPYLEFCLGADTCEINYTLRNVLIHADTNTQYFNFPIHKNTYGADYKKKKGKSDYVDIVMDSDDKKEKRLHIVSFRMQKTRDDDDVTIEMSYDITNADIGLIKSFIKNFTDSEYFVSISFDYTILPEKEKIKEPVLRTSDFKERKKELVARIAKLNDETMVKYQIELDKLRAEGAKLITSAKAKELDAEAEEIGANNARRSEIAKIKGDNEEELRKVIAANKIKTDAAEAKLREAREERERIEAEITRREEGRALAKRQISAKIEEENKKREAERKANEEIAKIKASHEPIDEKINELRITIGITNDGWSKKGDNKHYIYVLKLKKFKTLYKKVEEYKAGALSPVEDTFDEDKKEFLINLYDTVLGMRSDADDEESKTQVNTAELTKKLLDLTKALQELEEEYRKLEGEIDLETSQIDAKIREAEKILREPNIAKAIEQASAKEKAAKAATTQSPPVAAAAETTKPPPSPLDATVATTQSPPVAAAVAAAAVPATAVAKPTYPKYVAGWIRHPSRIEKGKPAPEGFIEIGTFYYKTPEVVLPKSSAPTDIDNWTLVGDYYFKKFYFEPGLAIPPDASSYKCLKTKEVCEKIK